MAEADDGIHLDLGPKERTDGSGVPLDPDHLYASQVVLFLAWPVLTAVLIGLHVRYEGFRPGLLVAGLVLAYLAVLSVTLAHHRLASHRSFEAHPVLKYLLLFLSPSGRQYSAMKWASYHRAHHQSTDDPELDPHAVTRGLLYAHLTWVFTRRTRQNRQFLVPDLARDPAFVWQHRNYDRLVLFHTLVLPLLAGALVGAPLGGLAFLGFLKLFLAQQAMFCVNSVCHRWGSRPYLPDESARDNLLMAPLTAGEGYHNYHHAFPFDYRIGHRWYHIDPGKWVVFLASKLGLAGSLKRADPEAIAAAEARALAYSPSLSRISGG